MSGLWTPPGSTPPSQAQDDGIECRFEPYDSELLVIERVFNYINEHIVGKPRSVDATSREIEERFAEVGFKVSVVWYEMLDRPGTYSPKIVFEDRMEPTAEGFDHDRQMWEVQHDILGIDSNPGAMQPDGTVKSPSRSTAFIDGQSAKG